MSKLDPNSLRLTETVQKGGCAAKLPAGSLRELLGKLSLPRPPELSIGTEHMDDACIWDLGNGTSLVQTLDFFTPIVDDIADFGAIAAANALSDVYAMGGEPRLALSILAWPSQQLPLEWLEPLLSGALEKIRESGACLAGGHTIDDETLKFGLSVTGFVPSNRVWSNTGARPGDLLILTKSLGTGTITSALKRKEAEPEWVDAATKSMKQLNRVLHLIAAEDVRAATDITGFGLAGHALQLARASDVSVIVNTNHLPVIQGARHCLERGILNRAHKTNLDYVKKDTEWTIASETTKWLCMDPQTSGGLLLAVSEARAEALQQSLLQEFPQTRIIGQVERSSDSDKRLRFRD